MPRLKVTMAYDGTEFHGWQRQGSGSDQPRTVQSCLERTLFQLSGRNISVHGAGRTDAGVHAEGQAAHFDVPEDKLNLPWLRALNALLPEDVAALAVEQVPDDFHARFQALEKLYAYSICLSQAALPLRRRYVWRTGPLDLAAMKAAAREFIGSRDFAAFQNRGTPVKSAVRNLTEISCLESELVRGYKEAVFLFRADGFLKQMVRNIMGCLVAVGRGGLKVSDVAALLEGRERSEAPATAPAKGLVLKEVIYRPE